MLTYIATRFIFQRDGVGNLIEQVESAQTLVTHEADRAVAFLWISHLEALQPNRLAGHVQEFKTSSGLTVGLIVEIDQ